MLPNPIVLARWSALGLAALVGVAQSARAVTKPAPLSGKQIYAARCASCHGAKGEGSAKYQKALIGSKSVPELAAFVAKSMPPGAAKKLPAADAKAVTQFFYDAFYSPVAQARNRPPRIELSRLTVRQYRNSVTDLVGSFRQPARFDDQRGLRAVYFKTRRLNGKDKVLERVDPQVDFDFGTKTAIPEQTDAHTFSMRWDGSVLAPDTGEYEFIVKTEHATRLWVNDLRKPLIDAFVKSGNDKEYHGTLFLLGGRAYPIRLEFSKANQGVDDTAKLATRPVAPATLSLDWKRPKQAPEVIPQRCLVPRTGPEVFAVESPFPPDDRSMGYERGTSVSKEWDEATTEGALETANYVAGHLRELSGVADNDSDRATKLRAFCGRFTERAFRRPLTPEQVAFFVDRQFQNSPDLETSVKKCVLLALKSPRFLFRELDGGTPDAYDVAARLSFGLWDSLPDSELLKAAAAGQLSTQEQVERQAERMVNDPRAHAKVREFFLQWLKIDDVPDLVKDQKRFPGFDAAVATDLRTSLDLTLDSILRSSNSDFRDLLLGDKVFLNGRLAKLYGVSLPENAPFQAVALDPGERAGVLTHPYLLSRFAYMDTGSPIHRGVLVVRSLLGRVLSPPPVAVAPVPVDAHPNLTTRERITLQTTPAACSSCHSLINPLGFTLEKFDGIGRLRKEESGKPVDSSGSYHTPSGKLVKFSGARDLATYLAGSEETESAFVEKLFQYLVKQPVRAYGPQTPDELRKGFADRGFNMRKQVIESVVTASLSKKAATPEVQRAQK